MGQSCFGQKDLRGTVSDPQFSKDFGWGSAGALFRKISELLVRFWFFQEPLPQLYGSVWTQQAALLDGISQTE